MAVLEDVVEETLTVSETEPTPTSYLGVQTAEIVRMFSAGYWARLLSASGADALTLSESIIALVGAVVIERLNIAESFTTVGTFGLVHVDAVQLADAGSTARQGTALDTLTMAEVLEIARGVHILESLGLAETLAGSARYGISRADNIRLVDRILQFLGGEAADTLQLAPVVQGQQLAHRTVSDTLELVEGITPKFLIGAVAQDVVDLSADQVIQMLFQPHLRETVEFSGAYISPGGGFTAWTMNTRTAAVTEYTNFEFNSFAAVGNKYLAASSSGLFELLGDTDDGDDIVARIKSGYMQFGGVHLSRLKAAYIATRGAGDFILRIITGDGVTYDYAASTRDMLTTKVNMGKGQRARYFAFDLLSAGQDFDLDSIEFVPIVVQRRG